MLTAPAEVGSTANSYQILAKLAVGGMAEIFLARGESVSGLERYCVLKRVLRERANDVNFVRMFLDEAKLASQLQHPNVAQVYDIGKLGDSYFFTMEYVHGETVRSLMQRTRTLRREVPLGVILAIIAQTAAGLHHAHERLGAGGRPLGIVHRDVSPSNLMASYEGNVKVVDFGVAKAADRTTETRAGTVKGKIAYLAPEQCRGAPVDRRCDLFALGIVMWEMLALERLYKRNSDFETMAAIVGEAPPRPSAKRAGVPPAIDAIVLKLLSKRAGDRYPSGAAVVEAIEQAAAATGIVMSGTAVARFLKELFGQRPEPWLELESEMAEPVTVTSEPIPADLAAPQPATVDRQLAQVRSLPTAQRDAVDESDGAGDEDDDDDEEDFALPAEEELVTARDERTTHQGRITAPTVFVRPPITVRTAAATAVTTAVEAEEGADELPSATAVARRAEPPEAAAEAGDAEISTVPQSGPWVGAARSGPRRALHAAAQPPTDVLFDADGPEQAPAPRVSRRLLLGTTAVGAAAAIAIMIGLGGERTLPPDLARAARTASGSGEPVVAPGALLADAAPLAAIVVPILTEDLPDAPLADVDAVTTAADVLDAPAALVDDNLLDAGIAPADAPVHRVASATDDAVGDAFERGRWAEALAACNRGRAPAQPALCALAACRTHAAPDARRWYEKVPAKQRTVVEQTCAGANITLHVRRPPPTDRCAADPMSCQH